MQGGGQRLDTPSVNEQTMGSAVPTARLITNAVMTTDAQQEPRGRCLLVVFETGIWASSEHWPMYRAWRDRFSPMPVRIEHEGHVFEADEMDECQTLACMAICFGWGFRLIGEVAGLMIECNHDGRLRTAAREQQNLVPLATSLVNWFT